MRSYSSNSCFLSEVNGCRRFPVIHAGSNISKVLFAVTNSRIIVNGIFASKTSEFIGTWIPANSFFESNLINHDSMATVLGKMLVDGSTNLNVLGDIRFSNGTISANEV